GSCARGCVRRCAPRPPPAAPWRSPPVGVTSRRPRWPRCSISIPRSSCTTGRCCATPSAAKSSTRRRSACRRRGAWRVRWPPTAGGGWQVFVFPPPAVGEIVLTGPSTLDGEIAARYLGRCRAEVVRRPLDDLFDGVEPLTIVAMDEEPRIEALIARLEGGLDY